MKRLQIVFLFLCVFILVACGESENDGTTAVIPTTSPPDVPTVMGLPITPTIAPTSEANPTDEANTTGGSNPTDAAERTEVSPTQSATTVNVVNNTTQQDQICTVRTDWQTYTVQQGDTLAQIARNAGSTLAELVQGNCLVDANLIQVGQQLYIPHPVVTTPIPQTPIPPTPSLDTGSWASYLEPNWHLKFSHPANWRETSLMRIEGSDGFVIGTLIESPEGLDVVTQQQANHQMQPFGSSPLIETVTLTNGWQARMILPTHTTDPMALAALMIPYNQMIEWDNHSYNYLFLNINLGHIRAMLPTIELSTGSSVTEISQFDVTVEDLPNNGKRLHLNWSADGATKASIHTTYRLHQAEQWDVLPTGEMTLELPETVYANPRVVLQVWNGVTGETDIAEYVIPWTCTHTYFFESQPNHCPSETAVTLSGAYQPFEHGFMIWEPSRQTGSLPTIHLFLNGGSYTSFPDTWIVGEPESDSTRIPPEGLHQPVRGFGKVWRDLDSRYWLGWATATESAYQLTTQAEIFDSNANSGQYITLPTGEIIYYTGINWTRVSDG